MLALVADEEYASIGAQDFVKRHKADACVVTEPSEGRLILCHKGFAWVGIVTKGRAAHGSRWDLGVSAIAKMGKIIAAIERFDQQELRSRTHPLDRIDDLKVIDRDYRNGPETAYKRAWEIVNEIEGYQPFMEELKALKGAAPRSRS